MNRSAYLADFLRPVAVTTPLFRVGAFGDGGYLVPNDLDGVAACYSPGVSRQSSFELELAKHAIPSFLADASVEGPAIDIPGSHFLPKFVGAQTAGDTIALASWVAQTDPCPGADLLLQMDIEGGEYATLAAAPDALLERFRVIVLELHRLPSVLTKQRFFDRAKAMIDRLVPRFETVHLHTNNAAGTADVGGVDVPRVVEVTLLRKDRARVTGPVRELPHPLDRRHRPDRPDIPVPADWLCGGDQAS